MHRVKERLQLAFTVFALFFGAGNLIFPPFLAWQSGENLLPAFCGFIITAMGFPVLSLIAIGKTGSLDKLSSRVHPLFSRIFTITIYLAIGPCLAIPRTASTSYEMVKAAAGIESPIWGLLYSAVFFILAGIIAFHPEKLSKSLGRILSPLLILLIIILFIGTAGTMAAAGEASAGYAGHPFATGFREGYQTMDAIAGLVFGIVVAMNAAAFGYKEKEAAKEGMIASAGGGILLLAVYSALTMIGTKAAAFVTGPETGADILSGAAAFISSDYGRFLIAAIFVIACFNTSVGLLSSCGEYFSRIIPGISKRKWIIIFAVISGIIANAGLGTIISISSPILELIYPAAIVLILLAFFPYSEKYRLCYVLSVSAALISSFLSMIGIPLPFSSAGFGWLLPTLAAAVAGYAYGHVKK